MFEQKPIPAFIAVIMVLGALLTDGFQLLISFAAVIGDIASGLIAVMGYGTYWLWFKVGYGINMMSPKKMLAMLGGGTLEAAGIILPADLPGLTLTVVLIIIFSRMPALKIVMEGPKGALAGGTGAARAATSRELVEKTSHSRGMAQRLRNQPKSFARNMDVKAGNKAELGVAAALERSKETANQKPSNYRKIVRRILPQEQDGAPDSAYRKTLDAPAESQYRKAA